MTQPTYGEYLCRSSLRMAEANAITDEQAAYIKDELRKLFDLGADIDTKRLLNYIGAASVEEIPAARYDEVVELMKRKEEALREEKA